jgi:hypothetical protein
MTNTSAQNVRKGSEGKTVLTGMNFTPFIMHC